MPFHFTAKYGLLTYAQAENLDSHRIVCKLTELGAECIVGRELHQDGGIHYHAFFMFEREFRTRNERVFDVDGYHPNIVRGYGTPEKGFDYATKDGEIVGGGLERPSGTSDSRGENKWAKIIMAECADDFFARAAEYDPRALCCNFGNLEKYANWRYRPILSEYEHPERISFISEQTEDMDEWARTNIGQPDGGKLLRSRTLEYALNYGHTSELLC